MVQGINDQCDELTHISFYKVRFLIKFRWEICKVCCDNFTDISLIIILIEFIKSVCEQSECCTYKDTSGVTLFQLFCNIKHTFSGRNHIINDKDILSCYIITEELMGNDWVLSIYNRRVVTTFVEHTHINTKHVREVYCTVHSSLIRADDHQVFFVSFQIRYFTEQCL